MVPLMSLWWPILLSAIVVFVVSSFIHMVLPYHRNNFKKLAAEDEFMGAVRKFELPPGEYFVPCAGMPKEMKNPGFLDKMTQGPVLIMTVLKSGPPSMGPSLLQWFLYSIVVGIFAGYIAGRALQPGAAYLAVFRFAGCTAFVGYALALWQNSIWYKRAWSTTLKSTFDGLVYALLTAGIFGWLWPR